MQRIIVMLTLVITGELVFGLAFNVPRFFRPTMLDVFAISNTQLGDMFAVYGVMALISYFPGGALADHFSARTLISLSLILTAIGGLYMRTIPGPLGMSVLYGYWGVTTIFLMWGALIRAARGLGGDGKQGLTFGILDGGRGLVAAILAFAAVGVLAAFMPGDASLASPDEQLAGFQAVVLVYSLVTFLAGVLAWFAMPTEPSGTMHFSPTKGMLTVAARPIVWAQAAIVVCAYCGYKGLDNYSLYAVQVLGMDQVEGARLATYGAWTRPLAALVAGILADRFKPTHAIASIFAAMSAAWFIWSLPGPGGEGALLIYANFFATYIFVFALRGVYFALLQQNQTPKHFTGATVGLVSMVGFAPDVFFASIGGRILDANPGLPGFQNYFRFLAAIMVAGLIATAFSMWLHRKGTEKLWLQPGPGTK